MNELLSYVLLVLIMMFVIAVVVEIGLPIVQSTQQSVRYEEAVTDLKMIDNYVREVSAEGSGSTRLMKFDSKGNSEVIKGEDAIQMEIPAQLEIISYFSRKISGNTAYISGNDVSCNDETNLTLENSYLRIDFNKIYPESAINTEKNILLINEKTTGNTIYPVNSSVIIDNNPATAYGTGYSEIPKAGKALPVCYAKFYINSTAGIKYEIVYKLYAGADFVVAEVHNIR